LDFNVVARAFLAIPPKKPPAFQSDLGSAAVNEQFDTRDKNWSHPTPETTPP